MIFAALQVMYFAMLMNQLCIAYSCSVTSWHRTPARNKAKGGLPTSLHLVGLAADLVPDDPAMKSTVITEARRRGLDAVDEGDHVHIELDQRNPR